MAGNQMMRVFRSAAALDPTRVSAILDRMDSPLVKDYMAAREELRGFLNTHAKPWQLEGPVVTKRTRIAHTHAARHLHSEVAKCLSHAANQITLEKLPELKATLGIPQRDMPSASMSAANTATLGAGS